MPAATRDTRSTGPDAAVFRGVRLPVADAGRLADFLAGLPPLALLAPVFRALDRRAPPRVDGERFAADLPLADFFAMDFLAVDFLAADFFAEDFLVLDFLAVDFLAVDFLAVDFFAVDFLAVDFLAVDFFAVDLRAEVFLAPDRFAVFRAPLDPLLPESVSVLVPSLPVLAVADADCGELRRLEERELLRDVPLSVAMVRSWWRFARACARIAHTPDVGAPAAARATPRSRCPMPRTQPRHRSPLPSRGTRGRALALTS